METTSTAYPDTYLHLWCAERSRMTTFRSAWDVDAPGDQPGVPLAAVLFGLSGNLYEGWEGFLLAPKRRACHCIVRRNRAQTRGT
jgi:hypothetical protein